ncbi:E3 ubiquitin-protein ligase RNF213-like [Terrapene carolina triunguis]|uniref:E3 ubiquitin-protein ligase RNF213-like n=1 Tax=Terrapene triunguis TaxID=2587831 RepID=UPI0011564D14|nr:E3 ubiquitin-protein ligase RNF213-like [Terrapene carolina triunguis]
MWLLYKIEDHKPAKIFEVVTKVLKRCSNNAATVYLVKGVNECKSCQNEITDPAELPCGHIFCTQCIREWNIRQCKICKESVPEDYVPTASQITREAVASHNKFRRKCNSFFVEFVSSYCFGDKIPPSAEIIEQLIKFVACKPSNSEHQEIRKEDASQNSEHVLSTADLSAPRSAAVTSIEDLQFIAKLRLAIGNVAAVLGRELPSGEWSF